MVWRAHQLARCNAHRCGHRIRSRVYFHAQMSLLSSLARLRREHGVWVALPRDVSRWWRQRDRMVLTRKGRNWSVEGEGSERARVAFATLQGDRSFIHLMISLRGLWRILALRIRRSTRDLASVVWKDTNPNVAIRKQAKSGIRNCNEPSQVILLRC
jgi:hypothetical protein